MPATAKVPIPDPDDYAHPDSDVRQDDRAVTLAAQRLRAGDPLGALRLLQHAEAAR